MWEEGGGGGDRGLRWVMGKINGGKGEGEKHEKESVDGVDGGEKKETKEENRR